MGNTLVIVTRGSIRWKGSRGRSVAVGRSVGNATGVSVSTAGISTTIVGVSENKSESGLCVMYKNAPMKIQQQNKAKQPMPTGSNQPKLRFFCE